MAPASPARARTDSISLTDFRLVTERVADPISEKQFEKIQELVVTARNAKAEMGLQKQKPSLQVAARGFARCWKSSARIRTPFCAWRPCRRMHLTRGRLAADLPDVASGASFDLRILHEEKVDHEAERARLQKEKQKLEQQLAQVEQATGQPGIRGARARRKSCAAPSTG